LPPFIALLYDYRNGICAAQSTKFLQCSKTMARAEPGRPTGGAKEADRCGSRKRAPASLACVDPRKRRNRNVVKELLGSSLALLAVRTLGALRVDKPPQLD
jgi:hypothetical protein